MCIVRNHAIEIVCTAHNFNPYTPHIQRAQNSATETESSTESLDGDYIFGHKKGACMHGGICDLV